MTERAKVIKIEVPVKKFRRSRKDWNGHCHEDECFNDGQPRECEAPDLCWPNNCCFREGTDRPLIARPTETVLMVPKSDLDSALSRIVELEALASRPEAPAAAGAAQAVAPYSFVCNRGCGVCTVKVTPFEYERTENLDGEHLGSKYRPQIVSACCGAEVHVYDNREDHWGEEVTIAAPASTPPAVAAPAQTVEVSDVIEWLGNRYQEYPNIASLCEAMRVALQASKPEGGGQ